MNYELRAINFKKLLPYLGIFFVLFMGSGLVKIPVGSALFYVIKFGIIIGVLGIGVWTWYKAKTNHQPPTAYLQLALFVPFTNNFQLFYAFIFLTIILFNKKLLLPWNSPLKPIYLLFIWGFISYVINQFIEFNPLSFPYFVVTFFLPMIFISLFYQFTTKENWNSIISFYINMLIPMIIIIYVQTFVWWQLHPDFRNGGVNETHTAAVYLSIGILLSIYRVIIFKKAELKIILFCAITIIAMYFIDAKYIFFFMLGSILPAMIYFFRKHKAFNYGITILISIIVIWLTLFEGRLFHSVLAFKGQNYKVSDLIQNYPNSDKFKLLINYYLMFKEHPINGIIGTGPGTFLSQASLLNSVEHLELSNNKIKSKKTIEINLLKSIGLRITSWCRLEYGSGAYYFMNKHAGSTFTDWKSSIINILFELGIIGLVLILFLLFRAYGTTFLLNDYMKLLPFFIFFALMLLFDLWAEYPRYRIIQDAIFGFIIVKKI